MQSLFDIVKAQPVFVKFPNGKVWLVRRGGNISGVVRSVDPSQDEPTYEDMLDALSQEVTGSIAGLTDISHSSLDDVPVTFSGVASNLMECLEQAQDEEDDTLVENEGYKVFTDIADPELKTLLKAQYGLTDAEVAHAIAHRDVEIHHEDEFSLGDGSLRTIKRSTDELGQPRSRYARVVVGGLEVARFDSGPQLRAIDNAIELLSELLGNGDVRGLPADEPDSTPDVSRTLSVNMLDIVGSYESADDVPEWKWVEDNASFAHCDNGQDGIWEFLLNLSLDFRDVPPKLETVIKDARLGGMHYLMLHQGT